MGEKSKRTGWEVVKLENLIVEGVIRKGTGISELRISFLRIKPTFLSLISGFCLDDVLIFSHSGPCLLYSQFRIFPSPFNLDIPMCMLQHSEVTLLENFP